MTRTPSAPASTRRAGFSLVELLIGMVVLGVIGTAIGRLMMSQSRYFNRQEATRDARAVSRGAANVLLSELRMLEPGGVVAASASAVTVRVPFAMGMTCTGPGLATVVSFLPTDSAAFARGVQNYGGYAWRNSTTGAYVYAPTAGTLPINLPMVAAPICAAASVTTIAGPSGPRYAILAPAITAGAAMIGDPLFLYQAVTYEFKASAQIPGRLALWRTPLALPDSAEEIAAPFDQSAHFEFYTADNSAAQTAPPADPKTILGLELHLDGASERTPRDAGGATLSSRVPLTTAVIFNNRAN
jgi:prepilin-type N-terminal cleavage/methylation domain-containing protein